MRKGIAILLTIIVLIGIVCLRIQSLGQGHFEKAESLRAKGLLIQAIAEYDNAIHSYLPFASHVAKSAERLKTIAEDFEAKGEIELARNAYSSLRSSFYGSRSFYTPGRKWIDISEARIAEMNVRLLIKEGLVNSSDFEAEKAKQIFVMKADRQPSVFWVVVSWIFFFGWIGGAGYSIKKGFDKEGSPKKPMIYYCLAWAAGSFAIWLLALYFA